jgi:two-component system, chemotaxis family, protein-glutamate methylesterase/glutaminase
MENLSKDKRLKSNNYKAVVIGVSAGGTDALKQLLCLLPAGFTMPVVIVQHLHPDQDRYLIEVLDLCCPLEVREAEEKEQAAPGGVYLAPPNYHLLIESDGTFSLSIDPKVNFSRPSIDVLFESAADAYCPELIGIILTGASCDGAAGLRRIKDGGGMAIVQDPAVAEYPTMPSAAIEKTKADYILDLPGIGKLLAEIGESKQQGASSGK